MQKFKKKLFTVNGFSHNFVKNMHVANYSRRASKYERVAIFYNSFHWTFYQHDPSRFIWRHLLQECNMHKMFSPWWRCRKARVLCVACWGIIVFKLWCGACSIAKRKINLNLQTCAKKENTSKEQVNLTHMMHTL